MSKDEDLTEKQIAALRRLAEEARASIPWSTWKALTDRGLIVRGEIGGWNLTEAGRRELERVAAAGLASLTSHAKRLFGAGREPVDVVMADAQATRDRDAEVKIWAPALILHAEHEGFLREVLRMEGGYGETAVLYVLLDGRHLRVEVKDLDGPTVVPPPSPFSRATWKAVNWGPGEAPPVEVDPAGLVLASQDPAKAVV